MNINCRWLLGNRHFLTCRGRKSVAVPVGCANGSECKTRRCPRTGTLNAVQAVLMFVIRPAVNDWAFCDILLTQNISEVSACNIFFLLLWPFLLHLLTFSPFRSFISFICIFDLTSALSVLISFYFFPAWTLTFHGWIHSKWWAEVTMSVPFPVPPLQ